MWIFTKDGFYSAVQKDCKGDDFLIRSSISMENSSRIRKLAFPADR